MCSSEPRRTAWPRRWRSPEDRAHYDYVVAKIYAKMGYSERSLEYLRRAMEEGYKSINSVYKDTEFAGVRKDPRFNVLMAAASAAITGVVSCRVPVSWDSLAR